MTRVHPDWFLFRPQRIPQSKTTTNELSSHPTSLKVFLAVGPPESRSDPCAVIPAPPVPPASPWGGGSRAAGQGRIPARTAALTSGHPARQDQGAGRDAASAPTPSLEEMRAKTQTVRALRPAPGASGLVATRK